MPKHVNPEFTSNFFLMLDQTFLLTSVTEFPGNSATDVQTFFFDIRDRVSWELSHGCHLNCDTASKSERFCWQILITVTSLTEIPGNAATDVSSITVPSLTENPGSLVMDAPKKYISQVINKFKLLGVPCLVVSPLSSSKSLV